MLNPVPPECKVVAHNQCPNLLHHDGYVTAEYWGWLGMFSKHRECVIWQFQTENGYIAQRSKNKRAVWNRINVEVNKSSRNFRVMKTDWKVVAFDQRMSNRIIITIPVFLSFLFRNNWTYRKLQEQCKRNPYTSYSYLPIASITFKLFLSIVYIFIYTDIFIYIY